MDIWLFLAIVALALAIVYLTWRVAKGVVIFYVLFVKRDDEEEADS